MKLSHIYLNNKCSHLKSIWTKRKKCIKSVLNQFNKVYKNRFIDYIKVLRYNIIIIIDYKKLKYLHITY
jgi:hypothetical protein